MELLKSRSETSGGGTAIAQTATDRHKSLGTTWAAEAGDRLVGGIRVKLGKSKGHKYCGGALL